MNSFIQRYIFHLRAGITSGSRVITGDRTRKFPLWLLRYQLQNISKIWTNKPNSISYFLR